MKRIGVFTSGGDSPGMNAAVRAVVRSGLHYGHEVVGIYRGYEGMIDGDMHLMDRRSVSNIMQLGGTILQSARSKRFMTEEGRAKAYEQLRAFEVEGIVVIGGNGSFTGAKVFMQEYPDLRMVGLPGTIDNDLYGTDYTIGYDTAINTAMAAIDNLRDTAAAHNRLFFVEVMGRDAGFIALRSGIATGAEGVLIKESDTDKPQLLQQLKDDFEGITRSGIVVVAEGDESGGAYELSREVQALYPDLDIRVTVLGHVQRGGRPTCMERVRASQLGVEAVRQLRAGKSGLMIGQQGHQFSYIPFEKAIKHHDRVDPRLLEIVKILA